MYAFQGTGNGHVARARDLVPRLAALTDTDVLVAGTQSDIDLGVPITFTKYGLTMVYDKQGSVSYWNSFWKNKPLRFLRDVWQLPVKDYDLVIIDFEAITSYACLLRGVKALQLSHQAAYLSTKTPRPARRVRHWEWVLKYMSPAKYAIGFHFEPYDSFVLPPIIRADVRALECTNEGHYTVYLPSQDPERLTAFMHQFPEFIFHIFARIPEPVISENVHLFPVDNAGFLQSFRGASGLICGAGFESPAEALFHGKKLLISPIQGQYEQKANAVCAERVGVRVFEGLNEKSATIWKEFLEADAPEKKDYPDYAQSLIECVLNNAREGKELDDISSLQVW